MGLFKKLNKMMQKVVTVPEDCLDDLVFTYSPQKYFKLDTPFKVPKNFVGIIVTNHRVCDLFEEGNHKLLVPFMPLVTKTHKLTRVKKDNTLKDKFKGRLYFINKGEFEGRFGDFIKIPLYDDLYKNIYGKITFGLKYKIVNYRKFLSELCFKNPRLTDKIAKESIGVYVEDYLANMLRKQKLNALDFVQKNIKNMARIPNLVSDMLSKVGIEMLDFELRKTLLDAKVVRRLKEKNSDLVFDENDMLILATKKDVKDSEIKDLMPFEDLANYEKTEKVKIDNKAYCIMDNQEKDNSEEKQEEIKIEQNQMQINEIMTQGKEEEEIKKCPNCGKNINKTAKVCYNCKYRFE